MASNSNHKLFLLLAAAALLFASACANSSLISEVCSKHTDGRYCTTQLGQNSFPDLPGLAAFSLRLSKARATHTKYINILLCNENTTDVRRVLEECHDLYKWAAEAIEESRESFEVRDYGKMNKLASLASTYASTCEDCFVEAKLKSPLSRHNRALQKAAQIVEIVANILDEKT